MNPEHRSILKEHSYSIAEKINIEDLKPLLLEYKIFNKYMWEDIKSAYDMFELLPTRGPKAFYDIINILRETNYNDEAEVLETGILSKQLESTCKLKTQKDWVAQGEVTKLEPSRYYTLNSKPLGYCLVINNFKFDESEDRYGTNVDADNIEKVFQKIGFDVIPKTDLSAAEMYECIEKFSKANFDNVDSAIVFILSHGGESNNLDFVRGTDEEYIFKNDIYKLFGNENLKLQGKPKIFFFVACRGIDKDYGRPKFFSPNSAGDVISIDASSNIDILPEYTDILIVHSSLPRNVNVRDLNKGTWFCQDFLSVLEESYKKCDLERILKDVNKKISKRIAEEYRNMQVIHVEHYGWMKDIMLCKQSEIVNMRN